MAPFLVLLWCWFPSGWACVLGTLGPLQQTLLRDWQFLPLLQPHRFLQPGVMRLYFPCAGTLGCAGLSWAAPKLYLLVFICMWKWNHLICQLLSHHMSSPTQLPISTPPISLDECFFFNSLVVGIPYTLIFWQFWLFLVFILIVILLWIVRGGKVYLLMPPYWSEVCVFFKKKKKNFKKQMVISKNSQSFYYTNKY